MSLFGLLNRRALLAPMLVVMLSTGCNSQNQLKQVEEDSLTIKILHINDHHSHLLPDPADLILAGEPTRVAIGGFPRVVSKFKQLSDTTIPVLKLHGGDAITGDLFYTLFQGKADAAMMNQICFDVFAPGNHEFDGGDLGLARFLDWIREGECNTEFVAANVKPELGVSPLALRSQQEYLKPYAIKTINDQQVAIIGIDIATKTKRSSNPDPTTMFLNEVDSAQKYIDELTAMGITKIILLTHYQYANDISMARKLRGIDVIVGGDSHTLLGDFEDVGLNPSGPYPTRVTDADGNDVCIVHAWQYSAVVGELNVTWDSAGNISKCEGTPHLLLADSFQRRDETGERRPVSRDAKSEVLSHIQKTANLSIVSPDEPSVQILSQYQSQVAELKDEIIGMAEENLCFERMPGQGMSKLCDVSATAAHGSDITSIVAYAFRAMSNTSDIGIQNGGGVRSDLAEGLVTTGDAYILLPFANTLVELRMSGAEIKQVLEDATDYALEAGGSDGAYPYAAGLRWHADLSKPAGQRFSKLEVKTKSDRAWQPLILENQYTVVTNSYIADGKDGYATFATISKEGRVTDTYLDYAQSFVEYVKIMQRLKRLETGDYSTQKFYDRNGKLSGSPANE